MAINAQNSGTPRELTPAGNHIARCFQMIHIGSVDEDIQGKTKHLKKVWISWELPNEIVETEKGQRPLTIGKEYTLSTNEKATLRKMLASWRGVDFTPEEAESFDVTKVVGAPCMLNIIHKTSQKGNQYADIMSVTPIPKGFNTPAPILSKVIFEHDNPDYQLLESLPGFIKDKVKLSDEFRTSASVPGSPAAQAAAAPKPQPQAQAPAPQQQAPAGFQQNPQQYDPAPAAATAPADPALPF